MALLFPILILQIVLFPAATVQGEEAPHRLSLEEMLQMEVLDLGDIRVVSASKRLQLLSETPATVRVVTSREIQTRGYLTLEDVLADLPGFQFRDMQSFNT